MVAACAGLGLAAAGAWTLTRPTTWRATALLRFGAERPPLEEGTLGPATPRDVYTEMRLIPTRPVLSRAVDAADLRLVVAEPRGLPRGALFVEHEVPEDAPAWAMKLRPAGPDGWEAAPWDGERRTGPWERVPAGRRVTHRESSFRLAAPTALEAAGQELPGELLVGVSSREWALAALRASLSGDRPGEARDLIEVSYTGTDRELAAEAANGVADAVLAYRRASQGEAARRRVAVLEGELSRVRGELAEAERALESSRRADSVVDLDAEARAVVSRLAALRAERAGIVAERAALERQLDRAREREPEGYRALAVAPPFLRNEAAADLMDRLAEADLERAALLTERTARHPEVEAVEARIRELEEEMGALAAGYRDRLGERIDALDEAIARREAELRGIPARESRDRERWRRGALLAALEEDLARWLEEARLEAAVEDAAVRVVERATVPTRPAGPNRPLHLAFGLAAGLAAGLGLGGWREVTDRSFGPGEDPARALAAPVLARVPVLPSGADAFEPVAAEAFRHLRTNLRSALPGVADARVLLVTSPLPADGKSLTAVGLARSLSESGLRVVLVDADLRKPFLHRALGASRAPGLSDVLAGGATLEDALRATAGADEVAPGGVTLLPAGAETPSPVELLDSDGMRELLAALAARFDRVVVDAPPALPLADATVIGAEADGALLVVRAGYTDRRAAKEAIQRLRAVGCPIAGLVFNAAGKGEDRYPYLYVTGYLREEGGAPADGEPAGVLDAPSSDERTT